MRGRACHWCLHLQTTVHFGQFASHGIAPVGDSAMCGVCQSFVTNLRHQLISEISSPGDWERTGSCGRCTSEASMAPPGQKLSATALRTRMAAQRMASYREHRWQAIPDGRGGDDPGAPARSRRGAPTLHGPLSCRSGTTAGTVILVMVVNAVYAALLIGNILVIAASLFLGQRLLRLCLAAVFVNAVALMLMVVPLLTAKTLG